jgi:hypothetical protein
MYSSLRVTPSLPGALLEEVGDLVHVRFDLGDEGDVRGAGHTRAPGDPTGVAAHDLDDHDPLVAPGRGPHSIYGLGSDGYGGVVAEGSVGGREVVIYGLGTADYPHAEVVVEPVSYPQSVVAADGDEGVYPELLHVLDDLLRVALVLVGVGAGGEEDGAALLQDVADVICSELPNAVGFGGEEPLPAALDARDLVAVVLDAPHSHGSDHAVRCRCVPATRENPNPIHIGHSLSSFSQCRRRSSLTNPPSFGSSIVSCAGLGMLRRIPLAWRRRTDSRARWERLPGQVVGRPSDSSQKASSRRSAIDGRNEVRRESEADGVRCQISNTKKSDPGKLDVSSAGLPVLL